LLTAVGAVPVSYPCIDIAPPEDTAPLDEALRAAVDGRFDWLILTSPNTVLSLARRVDALRLDKKGLRQARLAVVGPATAESARALLGLEPDVLPEEFTAGSLVGALSIAPGASVLLPQSNLARRTLADGLADAGLSVTNVSAYRTGIGSGGENVPALLAEGRIDALTLTSSSTVVNFIARLTGEGGDRAALAGVCIACIGPSTAGTARQGGLSVAVMPEEHTLEGMVRGLTTYFMEARETSWPTLS
jgi:uroporphyrinogen III methyltransferase/synthase